MYNFFAFLDRMKYIRRWSLMRSSRDENVTEHTQQVAVFAHALAVIDREVFGGSPDVEKTVLLALYHESSEVMTGDLPTPIKYFNREIHGAYKQLEERAERKLLAMLPEELQNAFRPCVMPDTQSYEYRLVKAADKLSAYIKCVEELKAGNNEFREAAGQTRKALEGYGLPEVGYFLETFMDSFSLTLDELK